MLCLLQPCGLYAAARSAVERGCDALAHGLVLCIACFAQPIAIGPLCSALGSMYMMHTYIYVHAHSYIDDCTTYAPTCASVCLCVCDWAPTHPRRQMRARSVGVDRGWLGSQAFQSASAFNADIGAWNTASVTELSAVCGAFPARAARHRRRDALGGSSMRRGPLCAAAPPMRARVCVRRRVGSRVRGCPRVQVQLRVRKTAYMYVCMYGYVCVFIIHIHIGICVLV